METQLEKIPIESLVKIETRNELIRAGKMQVILNQEPNPKWLLNHPMASGVKYLPIEKVEWLLTTLFITWNVEIKSVLTIANSVTIVVRLHYLDPVTGQMLWQDGIGAAPIQTVAGAGAMEWDKVQAMSVMKAAPAAESYAVKDAADKIGRIFGRDLNRKPGSDYDVLRSRIDKETAYGKSLEQ